MSVNGELPSTMKALVLEQRSEPLKVEQVPVPQPTVASAVVKIDVVNTISYMRDVYSGKRAYPFPTPMTPGSSAIARVASVGPDATKVKPGDLVFVDLLVRSRDQPTDVYLAGIHEGFSPGSAKLYKDVYRNWTYAEYCLVPLENLTVLNEKRLLGSPAEGGLGWKTNQLASASVMLVSWGGLRDMELKAGQTIVVAPATGQFGGGAVQVALAMGAKVIAMGRNKDSLANIKKNTPHPERVETVPITGDIEKDCEEIKKHGPVDAYFDIGPPQAYASTHIKSCINALRHSARISIMGGYKEDVAIPYQRVMHWNMRIYGKWMYEREDIVEFFKMVECGLVDLNTVKVVGEYPLEKAKEAWDHAAEAQGFNESVVIKP